MATVTLTRTYTADTVAFDGTNFTEIIALVGAAAVERPWNSALAKKTLRVNGVDIAVGESVAVVHGTTTPPSTGRKYVPGDPEYSE